MAQRIEAWQDNEGGLHKTEIEALNSDNELIFDEMWREAFGDPYTSDRGYEAHHFIKKNIDMVHDLLSRYDVVVNAS